MSESEMSPEAVLERAWTSRRGLTRWAQALAGSLQFAVALRDSARATLLAHELRKEMGW